MHKVRTQGINAALISAVFLGLAPVFGKAAMAPGHFSPLAVVALRTGMAALLLLLIMAIFKRQYIYIYPAGLLGCALAGGINGVGSIFYYMGLDRLNASVAQTLYSLYPFFVAVWLWLDRQPASRFTIIRIVIASGSAVLLTQAGPEGIDPWGVFFMLVAAALYAFHIPINQRVLYDVPPPTVTLYTLIAMSAVVIPVYLIADRSLPEPGTSWTPVLWLTGVTFMSRLLLFTGVKHIGGMQTADVHSMGWDHRSRSQPVIGLVRKTAAAADAPAWHPQFPPTAGFPRGLLQTLEDKCLREFNSRRHCFTS
jgi:drug/metabolite transporter (DMT)-like permease